MTTYLLVVLIALFGALMRTVFGFGEALVTMPLLALISFNLQTSTALIGALGLLVAIPVAIKYHQHIDWSTLKRLVLGSILGIPIGILIIKLGSPIIIMKFLGLFIIIYGTAKKWDADKLKGILQGHFVCVGSLVVLSQLGSGMWSLDVVKLLIVIIPLLFIVIPLGNWISTKIDSQHFTKYVFMILIIFGIILLLKN